MHTPRLGLLFAVAMATLLQAGSAQVSKNCQLLSQITRPGTTGYAGVWGYAAGGREFALVGARNGTWIVETTIPTALVEKGFITGPSSTWREISSYGQYVYVVTEAAGGVQIISMANPDSPTLVKNFTLSGWNNTHTVSVDQTAGRLYCNGTSQGMMIFDLTQDPTTPGLLTTWTSAYVHDSFVQNGLAYLSCINNGQLRIMNVANLPAVTQLSATRTPNAFTHNAWANSTDTICVTTDETSRGYMQVYDVTNKALPIARGRYSLPDVGIHNVYIVGNTSVHIAYYGGGYRLVNIANPSAPRELAYYRTASAWGCYPFQPSQTIYVSGIPSNGGLYCLKIVRPN